MIARQRNRWLDWNVIATVLITKFLILGFAYQSFQVVNDQPVASSYRFFEIWKHWDAESYLKIAELGYSAVGERRFLIVYFPLYPSLVALVELLTGDSLISAFLVSLLSSV